MKATDLMLGDWVYAIDTMGGAHRCIAKVLELGENPYLKVGIWGEFHKYELLEPLPLTPEILEKNGFKEYGDTGWWLVAEDYYDIHIYERSDSVWLYRYESAELDTPHTQTTIGHVHELQHALRLCGIEKEIVL